MYITKSYDFLMDCPVYHYKMSIFLSCYLFCLEIYFVWCRMAMPTFLRILYPWVSSFTPSLRADVCLCCWDAPPGGSVDLGLDFWPPRAFWLASSVHSPLGWLSMYEVVAASVLSCFLIALCLRHSVSLVFLSAILVWWFSVVVFPFSLF